MGCIDDQELQAVQNIVHLQRWYFDFNIFCFLYCLEKNGRKDEHFFEELCDFWKDYRDFLEENIFGGFICFLGDELITTFVCLCVKVI